MKRTRWFDQTMPGEEQFNYDVDSRTDAILERFRASTMQGILVGLEMTAGPDLEKVQIATGEGFTGGFPGVARIATLPGNTVRGRGQRIEVQVPQLNIAAAANSPTPGDLNFVILRYVEIPDPDSDLPIRDPSTPGETTETGTKIESGFEIDVLSASQFDLLSLGQQVVPTDGVDDTFGDVVIYPVLLLSGLFYIKKYKRRDLSLLVGIFETVASGVVTEITSIADLPLRDFPVAIPSSGFILDAFGASALAILEVSDGTSRSTATVPGILEHDETTNKLRWKMPGDTFGPWSLVAMTGGQTVQLNDSFLETWIRVRSTETFPAVNPGGSIDIQYEIEIVSIYDQKPPRQTAEDIVHRNLVGTGFVTSMNPHGLTTSDVGGAVELEEHQDLFHRNGISSDADPGFLALTAPPPTVEINVAPASGVGDRFLIDGKTFNSVTGATSFTFLIGNQPDEGHYLVYLNQTAVLSVIRAFTEPDPVGATTPPFGFEIIDITNRVAGTGGTISWDSTAKTLSWKSPADTNPGAIVPVLLDGVYRLISGDTPDDFIDVEVTVADLPGSNEDFLVDSDLSDSDVPPDRILKIGLVYWIPAPAAVENPRDVFRVFFTSDSRNIIEAEHDSDGRHSKPFQEDLKIGAGRKIRFEDQPTADIKGGATGLELSDSTVIKPASEGGIVVTSNEVAIIGNSVASSQSGVAGLSVDGSGVAGASGTGAAVSGVSGIGPGLKAQSASGPAIRIVPSGLPSTGRQAGDLVFNSADSILYFYDGTDWIPTTTPIPEIVQGLAARSISNSYSGTMFIGVLGGDPASVLDHGNVGFFFRDGNPVRAKLHIVSVTISSGITELDIGFFDDLNNFTTILTSPVLLDSLSSGDFKNYTVVVDTSVNIPAGSILGIVLDSAGVNISLISIFVGVEVQ